MKKVYPKKPTELHIWNMLKSDKSLEGLIKRSTPEVAEYIKKVEIEFRAAYQKWFDVCFLIFSQTETMRTDTKKKYLKEHEDCRDVVECLSNPKEGVEYQNLIWKKLKPVKAK